MRHAIAQGTAAYKAQFLEELKESIKRTETPLGGDSMPSPGRSDRHPHKRCKKQTQPTAARDRIIDEIAPHSKRPSSRRWEPTEVHTVRDRVLAGPPARVVPFSVAKPAQAAAARFPGAAHARRRRRRPSAAGFAR
jgi:hypothetical protein